MLSKFLHIGVFIPAGAQLLDLSPIDLFGMLDPSYLRACKLPDSIVAHGIPSKIFYISMPESGTHVELTASAMMKISHHTTDPEVQPGNLDIILVPGPDPSIKFKEDVLEFLRGHAAWEGKNGHQVEILSVCTGCILLGQSGVLEGKKASGPRMLVDNLRKDFPKTLWIDNKRWVKDGNIWSSGGITNGQEMVAAYIKTKFPGPAAEVAISMADVGDKGIDYSNSKSGEKLWWLWTILKSMIVGPDKSKKF